MTREHDLRQGRHLGWYGPLGWIGVPAVALAWATACGSGGSADDRTAGDTIELCTNTCDWARDGDCDDGGPSSDYNLCELGTDCADCGVRRVPASGGFAGYSPDAAPDAVGSGGDTGTARECTFNSSCPSRHVCRSGRCVRVECTSNSHCSGCQRCSDNVCRSCGSGPYGCYC
jgi:hypothetical protein